MTPVDWNRPVKFRDGTIATPMPRETAQDRTGDTRRRFLRGTDNQDRIPTIVRVDENGCARSDGTESDWDIVNQ